MKSKIIALAVAVALSGCSSFTSKKGEGDANALTPITAQKLSSTFKRQGVKMEWDCMWGTGMTETTCVRNNIKAVEVTGYANAYGNSEVMREQAFKVAHDIALDKLVRFVKQDITSSRVTTTMAKNIEKAQDRIKNRIKSDEEVPMSDEDAAKDTNFAVRENTNQAVRTITETVRTNAHGIVKGARIIDESVVDRQTVSVTLRWDVDGDNATSFLRKNVVTN